MRLSVVGLALIVACTAVPATTTTTQAPPTTTAAPTATTVVPTTTTTLKLVPDPDFTIRIGVNSIPLFDPILNELVISEAGPYGLPQQPSLYRLVPPTSTLIPMLAADPTPPLGQASDDGWEIIVNLRTGVTWSDGTPVDAHDVAYTYQVLEGAAPWRFSHTVEAVDDFTVRYVWEERPTTNIWQFEVALAPIFSADFWRAQPERTDTLDFIPELDPTTIPTTGPYRLAEVGDDYDGWALEAVPDWWETGSTFTVWRNGAVRYRNPTLDLDETYGTPDGEVVAEWTVGPYAARIEYSVLSYQDELEAFRSGEIDLMLRDVNVPSGIPDLGSQAALVTGRYGPTWVAFDTSAPPFDDVAVRRAIACAFDPLFLAEEVLPGEILPPTGWGLGLGAWWEDAAPACDGAETGNILEGVLVGAVLVRPPESAPIPATAASWVYDWLAELGAEPIEGFLEIFSRESFFGRTDVAEFAVVGVGVDQYRLVVAPRMLRVIGGWEPPEAQVLLDRIQDAYDLETEQTAYREFWRLMAKEVPAVPILNRILVEAFNSETIAPPFLTPANGGFTTPLRGGLQAWEAWIIPATRPADG